MLSSSAVELKKQGKNNLFLYELCFEIWTIQEGKENSLSECWGGYSSKKRAMTSSIIDDCGVLGARFFREAPAGCCGCEAGAGTERAGLAEPRQVRRRLAPCHTGKGLAGSLDYAGSLKTKPC